MDANIPLLAEEGWMREAQTGWSVRREYTVSPV